VITDLVRKEIRSYKQLPVNFYQIQTKFRDEIRPRFGLMRGREFIMKDAYSFDVDEEGANRSYEAMYEAYSRIFTRCGLKFRAVEADSGAIGGSYSHEFMVLAETGEDQLVSCMKCNYAANLEKAEVKAPQAAPAEALSSREDEKPLQEVETPDIKTIGQLSDFLSVGPEMLIKTLIYVADGQPVAALVRGDHEINETKLKNYLGASIVELAPPEIIEEATGAPTGFAGPVGLKVRVVADYAIQDARNWVTGGNKADMHLINVRLGRDFQVDSFADLRVITPQDPCPRCGGPIHFSRGIEVGHIFKLGTKYSKAMKAHYLDENGEERLMVMGCYGIGVGRTVAAAIEQNHDEYGIIFPIPIAPFEVVILALQMHEPEVRETAERLYSDLVGKGVDVLLDDRDERPGVKFNDADLVGIPIRVTVGQKGLKNGKIEIRLRNEKESYQVDVSSGTFEVIGIIQKLYDSIH
ncbi:MAG: proline--tRNA ligase, partial [Deltaproteobacteria bacterium]